MNPISFLEDFSADVRLDEGRSERLSANENEARLLQAFEKGYKEGWDDCEISCLDEKEHQLRAMSSSLSELSFGYNEAREHVLSGVELLFKEIVSKVVPSIAKVSLPFMAWECVRDVLSQSASGPVTVIVSPGLSADVREILGSHAAMPTSVIEESTLTDGQAFIKSVGDERSIDIVLAISEVEAAVADFFAVQNSKISANE